MVETRAPSHRLQRLGAIMAGFIDPVTRPEYHGIRMRSKLETQFAAHLDAEGVAWRYEPALYGRYLPDFELVDVDPPTFIELKPLLRNVAGAKKRICSIWRAHPTALLVVACAEGSTWFGAVAGGEWTSWVERWAH